MPYIENFSEFAERQGCAFLATSPDHFWFENGARVDCGDFHEPPGGTPLAKLEFATRLTTMLALCFRNCRNELRRSNNLPDAGTFCWDRAGRLGSRSAGFYYSKEIGPPPADPLEVLRQLRELVVKAQAAEARLVAEREGTAEIREQRAAEADAATARQEAQSAEAKRLAEIDAVSID